MCKRQVMTTLLGAATLCVFLAEPTLAQDETVTSKLNAKELIQAGGYVGIIILGLSVAMIALIFEHLLSIRRGTLMPHGLAEEAHRLVGLQQYAQAEQQCKLQPSFLGYVISAGLAEVEMGYSAVEKAMEDASMEQAARLFRKIEYLSVIGTLAPMLGLLGTVWGMILAFMEFEIKANPQVSELAPGIYRALVTTLLGLSVAVPALAAFAIFRNRVDELVAESTLMAERVFTKYKRVIAVRRNRAQKKQVETKPPTTSQATSQIAGQTPTPPTPIQTADQTAAQIVSPIPTPPVIQEKPTEEASTPDEQQLPTPTNGNPEEPA